MASFDWPPLPSGGGGSGTVTSVSVVTANGVSGSVANATTTPAITLTLGAITPTSVAAVGTVTGSNLSGTNTGNVTLATFGTVPNTSGASISGQALTLQPADGTNPGGLSATTQSIGGNKTFTGSISASNLSGTNSGDVTLTAVGSSANANGASLSGQALTLQPATASFPGVLTAADWTTFNNKQAAGSYITALTGDVAASGPGSAAATLASTISGAKTFSTSLTSPAFISSTANPASAGVVRLANTNLINWRNAGNSADLGVQLDASNIFQFGAAINSTGTITTADNTASTSTTTGALRSSGGLGVAGSMSFGGGVYLNSAANVVTVSSNHTVLSTEYIILLDSSGGVFNLTLPNPNTVQMFIIKCSTGSCQTNPVTIVRNGSEQIDGTAASKVFSVNFGSWMFVSNGTNWFTVG